MLLALIAVLVMATGCDSAQPSADDPLSRGLAARAAGDLDKATQAYFETLAKDPKNKYALFNLGEIAQTQKRMAVAEGFYRMALEQDPAFISPLFNLAIVRTGFGDTTEAVDLYRRAVAADPKYAAAHYNLGLLLRQLGETADAQKELAIAEILDRSLVAPSVPPPQPSATARP